MKSLGPFPCLGSVVVLFAFAEQPAYGYTDPGTGALVWQMVVAGILGFGFYCRNLISWWKRDNSKPDKDTPK